MKSALLFIAIVAESDVFADIRAFQRHSARHFDSSRALRSPPHITLEPPFKWRDDELAVLESELALFGEHQSPIELQLDGFDRFASRVVFVDVVENPSLSALQAALKERLRSNLGLISDRPDRTFRPHMTVAFKDLKRHRFAEAWAHFSNTPYQKTMSVNRFSLLQHDGQFWQQRKHFDLLG